MTAAILLPGRALRWFCWNIKTGSARRSCLPAMDAVTFQTVCREPFCYRSGQPDFPWKALGAFTLPMTLEYFEDLGVLTRERDGYLYPYSGQASAVLDALRLGLARESVQVVTECEVFSITPREDAKHRFEVKTSQGNFFGRDADSGVRQQGGTGDRFGWKRIQTGETAGTPYHQAASGTGSASLPGKSSLNSSLEYARMPL